MIIKDLNTTPNELQIDIFPDYMPVILPAWEWVQAANGEQVAIDRGVAEDRRQSTFNIRGREADVQALHEFLNNARRDQALSGADNYQVNIKAENTGEYIFGPDILFSNEEKCTVLEYGKPSQRTWKYWELQVKVQAVSPTFTGVPDFPTAFCAKPGITTYSTWEINKIESYEGAFTFADHNSDVGLFSFKFEINSTEMGKLIRYIYDTNRAQAIDSTLWPNFYKSPATENPFDIYGVKRDHLDNNFKIYDFKNIKYSRPGYWWAEMVIVESFEDVIEGVLE
jgi:hypothetical protein